MDRILKSRMDPLSGTALQSRQAPARRFSPVVLILLGALIVAVAVAGYFYYQYRNAKPGVAEAKETKALTETISELMLLPEGEEPTLATVTDRTKLADQPFFQKAENGDKVLIYSNSGRAILFRPSQNKIVDVTAVNTSSPVGSTPAPSSEVPAVSQSVATAPASLAIRVALYNGSAEKGAANKLEKQITSLYPDTTFSEKVNAAKEYDGSVVVDLTGKNSVIAQALSNLVKGSIGTLPAGEKTPANADVLIIIGKGSQ
jgi:hypothetical protein